MIFRTDEFALDARTRTFTARASALRRGRRGFRPAPLYDATGPRGIRLRHGGLPACLPFLLEEDRGPHWRFRPAPEVAAACPPLRGCRVVVLRDEQD